MKILISAYVCGPTPTSETGNAWRAVNTALAAGHEVWTITETQWEKHTLDYLAQHPMPGYHPLFFQLAPAVVWAFRRRNMLTGVYYHLWQQRLLSVAAELHRQVGFDVAHHVTFGRYWSPSGVRRLGIPFIWGPVGAAEYAPRPFVRELPARERRYEFIRDGVRRLSHRDPALRETARAATVAIGVSREACAALRALGATRVEQMPQASLTDDELKTFDAFPPPPPGPFRAICMGRQLHWKGFHLAIRAFARFARTHPDARLWVVGSGPFQPELRRTAAREKIENQVDFFGHLPTFEAVMQKLAEAHVHMHPALHEAFGNVCMEALAAGRPVVCLDVGGPAMQVTDACGFIAPATTPDEALDAMAGFLTRVADDRALLQKMSLAARARVREKFTMRAMGTAFLAYYAELGARRA